MCNTCTQAVAFAFVSHMTMTANNTAAHLRYQALERQLERLEERGRMARQRVRRTRVPVGTNSSGEGSQAHPIIIMDDDEQLQQGLPPSPGPVPAPVRRVETLIPDLDRCTALCPPMLGTWE